MPHTRGDLSLATTNCGRRPFLTYEPYYGLREKPFSLSSDPRFLYKSRAHASVYDDLRAGICRREGLIVLTGDIGAGKTTLCRSVLGGLDRKTFSAFVPDPFVSREDLLKMLLIDFGVTSVDDLRNGSLNTGSRLDLSLPLYEFLKALVPLQAFAVLVIDEAQNLSQSLLEEIRILSDLEGPEKLLQVVLVGQLELLPTLKDPRMRQLDQRVSVRCQLGALDREGVAAYIAHRLEVAGGAGDRVGFAHDAVDVVYRASHGNPRLINLICDRSLHHGHVTRTVNIGSDLVTRALNELGVTLLTPVSDPMEAFRPEVSLPETQRSSMSARVPPALEALAPEPMADVREKPREDRRDDAAQREPSFVLPTNGRWRMLCWAVAGLVLVIMLLFEWLLPYAVVENIRMPQPPRPPMNGLVIPAVPRTPAIDGLTSASPLGAFEVGAVVFASRGALP